MLPDFMLHPDANYREHREWARDAYQQRGDEDRPLLLNSGYGLEPLDLDTALLMFERLAAEVLR